MIIVTWRLNNYASFYVALIVKIWKKAADKILTAINGWRKNNVKGHWEKFVNLQRLEEELIRHQLLQWKKQKEKKVQNPGGKKYLFIRTLKFNFFFPTYFWRRKALNIWPYMWKVWGWIQEAPGIVLIIRKQWHGRKKKEVQGGKVWGEISFSLLLFEWSKILF